LSDLAGGLFGGLIGDELTEGRGEKAATKQLAAFSAGRAVTIPCAFRESTGAARPRWRHGRLELSKGRAAWTRRFGRAPELVLGRGETTALHSRSVTRTEALRVNPKLVVLAYQRGESTIEFAIRHGDLRVMARVLEIPATQR
jgi:hypothetical protein